MAKEFPSIDDDHRAFIARQKIFFTASAAPDARVNMSPREASCFRVLGPHAAVYLDRTGSGAETAAHLRADGRITIMFCAFEGPPNILRLYGRGRSLKRGSADYARLLADHYDGAEFAGARQMVAIDVDLVKTSCGYGVPHFDYRGERPSLDNWARARTAEELVDYRRLKNAQSMDGLPTGLLD